MKKAFFILLLMLPYFLYAQAEKNDTLANGKKCIAIGNGIFTTEEELKVMVESKLEAFAQGLQILVERRNSNYSEVIDFMMRLFDNDSSKLVQVTSLRNPTPRTYKVPKYLYRVVHLPYKSIEVTASDIVYVSDMVLGADGQYHGASGLWLHINGRGKDGTITYKAATKKVFNFHVKSTECEIHGEIKKRWTIFLDNCYVKETLRD